MKQTYLTFLVGLLFMPTLLISQNFSISGFVTRHNGDVVPDIEISCFDTVFTDNDGFYEILDIPLNSTCELLPTGMNDKFEGITVLDALLLRQHILQISVLPIFQKIAGDITTPGVGAVTTFDMVKIIQLALRMEESVIPNWIFLNSNNPSTALFGITVTQNLENINFTAVKIGDVGISSDHIPAPPEASSPKFKIDQDEFETGDIVKIEVNVEDFVNIDGFQSSFSWDPNLLKFESISSFQDIPLFKNDTKINDGQLSVLMTDLIHSNIDSDVTLVTLFFEALADAPSLDHYVKMNDEMIPQQVVWRKPSNADLFIVEAEYIETDVQPVAIHSLPSEVVNFDIYPNPAQDNLNVNVLLNELTAFDISIVNVLGQKIFSKQFQTAELIEEIDVSNLASGTYFLSLRTERGVVTEIFVKE